MLGKLKDKPDGEKIFASHISIKNSQNSINNKQPDKSGKDNPKYINRWQISTENMLNIIREIQIKNQENAMYYSEWLKFKQFTVCKVQWLSHFADSHWIPDPSSK